MIKNLPAMGDPGSNPESGRSLEKGIATLLQYPCRQRGAWRATEHGVIKEVRDTNKQLTLSLSCKTEVGRQKRKT